MLVYCRRILTEEPLFPERLSADCRDLTISLLAKNPEKRLGVGGIEDVKRHPWFKVHIIGEMERGSSVLSQGVDWDKVLAKQLPPPFRPYISNEGDTGNFSTQFTDQAPIDSPAQPPTKHQDIFRVRHTLSCLVCVCVISCSLL